MTEVFASSKHVFSASLSLFFFFLTKNTKINIKDMSQQEVQILLNVYNKRRLIFSIILQFIQSFQSLLYTANFVFLEEAICVSVDIYLFLNHFFGWKEAVCLFVEIHPRTSDQGRRIEEGITGERGKKALRTEIRPESQMIAQKQSFQAFLFPLCNLASTCVCTFIFLFKLEIYILN